MTPRPRRAAITRRAFLPPAGAGRPAPALLPATGAWAAVADYSSTTPAGNGGLHSALPAGTKKKIPIGVFDPVYEHLSLDEMLDKVSALGLEAMEIGTGGYPSNHHCPLDDLVQDKAKA